MTNGEARDAHALAIGKIAMAWNEYHELLGNLFASLFTKSHFTTTLAIWHCLDNDRTQRRLLRAAAETYLHHDKKGLEELLWLLNKTDTLLAQQRNVGIHAPLNALFEIDGKHKLLSVPGPGNRNAKHLDGRDVLAEYAHYEQQIKKMREFAFALRFKLTVGKHTDAPWPTRPKLSVRPG
ncbi:hypothetical protein [Bradyrhizobium liaoningense]|uniref:hypothetical protein n=1 Tax=Bradyrhizobium liaoningense TaxID=43992 RepID=UPI001BAD78F6|nr:hypothetical protein [Bradyrhizobium liaoningense]MBR0714784.1 hypothetical protein [Bradyrhizobium liaoningense]